MDRTTIIVRYQWRAYWRGLSRRGKATAGNQGVALLILGLIFVRYLQWLRLATTSLSQGKTALVEALLVGLFFAWWFPLAAGNQTSIASRRWLYLPLSVKELFRIRVISVLMPPSSWLVIAASLTIVYPLAHAQKPVAGMLAAALFIAMSGLIGLTVSHLMNVAFWRRMLMTCAALMAGAVGFYTLSDKDPKGLLRFSKFLPSNLIARAALGQRSWIAIFILATLCLIAYEAALWSFRLSLQDSLAHGNARRQSIASFRLPGRLGGLLAKDARYFRRLLDLYLGLVVTAAGCVYLVTAAVPSRGIFLAFIGIVFLLGAAIPFNSFGLDSRVGLDRYTLLPLTGKSILLSKNLAYVIIMTAEMLPLLVLAGWRLGVSTIVFALLEAASLACAYLAWGNWMSVSHPVKMRFYRFANSGAALADALAGVVFGSLPCISFIYILQTHSGHAPALIVAVVLLFGALYWVSVMRFGRRLEQRRETMRARCGEAQQATGLLGANASRKRR